MSGPAKKPPRRERHTGSGNVLRVRPDGSVLVPSHVLAGLLEGANGTTAELQEDLEDFGPGRHVWLDVATGEDGTQLCVHRDRRAVPWLVRQREALARTDRPALPDVEELATVIVASGVACVVAGFVWALLEAVTALDWPRSAVCAGALTAAGLAVHLERERAKERA